MRLIDADATIKEIKARNPDDVSYEDAWAITCIEHAPTIEPDPYTVNRQVAIDAICDDWCGYTNANCPHGSEAEHYCDGCDAIHILKTLPPSQTPSRPQAEMIQESYYSNKLVCSNCGIEARWDYEFCPYCGLKFNQTGGAV